jgi:hypothetical protein
VRIVHVIVAVDHEQETVRIVVVVVAENYENVVAVVAVVAAVAVVAVEQALEIGRDVVAAAA